MMKKVGLTLIAAALSGFFAAAAADFVVPNRIATAKVGEWATYAMPNGYVQKQTVVSRAGEGPEAIVTVKIENIYQGQVITSSETAEQAGHPMREISEPAEPNVDIDVKTIVMEVKGVRIPATVIEVDYEYDDDEDEEVKWYLSAEVPVFGMVRQETDDVIEYELLDFGME